MRKALALAALLAACAPADPVYFPHHMHVTGENARILLGRWEGPYDPVRGGEGGVGALEVTRIDGTIARGRMTWARDGEVWAEQDVMIGLGLESHMMLESAHAELFRQGPELYIETDMMLPDGNIYLHRLARPAPPA